MTEGHKDGMTEERKHRFALGLSVKKQYWPQVVKRFRDHKTTGPDFLEVVCADEVEETLRDAEGKILTGGLVKNLKLSFPVTFAPEAPLGFRCVIAGEVAVLDLGNLTEDEWKRLAEDMDRSNAAQGFVVPPAPDRLTALQDFPLPSGRAEYFKTPGRLFDTPRHIEAKGKESLLPEIGRWYSQTALNRTVGMALAALTNTDTRDTILDWQSATVEEAADLVFCREEEGTSSYGQNREDILKACEALRAIPVPIVRIDWKQIGTNKHPRWVKE